MIKSIKRGIQKGMGMKILTCLVAMVWIFTVAEIVEGKQKGKMNSETSLPAEAAGWTWDKKEMKYNSKSLFDYMDGAAELYLAYGIRASRFESLKSRVNPLSPLNSMRWPLQRMLMGYSLLIARMKQ